MIVQTKTIIQVLRKVLKRTLLKSLWKATLKKVQLKLINCKDFYAKSDQVNSKEKTYSDAVKYSSISSKDYEVIPDSIKYGSVSSEKGFEKNKKYRESSEKDLRSNLATISVVISSIISVAAVGLLFYGFHRLVNAWLDNTFGRGNLLAMEQALRSKNCKLYFNGKLLK